MWPWEDGHSHVVPAEGSDYITVSVSPEFNMFNQGVQLCLQVEIIDDDILEDDESFCMRLTARDPAVILDPVNATVTIYDDDSEGEFSCYSRDTLLRMGCALACSNIPPMKCKLVAMEPRFLSPGS